MAASSSVSTWVFEAEHLVRCDSMATLSLPDERLGVTGRPAQVVLSPGLPVGVGGLRDYRGDGCVDVYLHAAQEHVRRRREGPSGRRGPVGHSYAARYTTSRRSTRRTKGIWVCPHTTLQASADRSTNASAHLAASQRHQLTVRVPPDQHHVVQPRQPIQALHRLRRGRVFTEHHDPVSAPHVRLSEHRVQHRQDATDIGQKGDGFTTSRTLPGAGTGQVRRRWR